jgi:ABC-2 type transport system ATP-binding protein
MLVVLAWVVVTLSSSTAHARDIVVASFDGTPIVTHFYPAAGLPAGERAPTVLYGSGFALRGPTTPDQSGGVRLGLGELRNDGYNVLTWDARGFGGSGGTSMFDSPTVEARDVQALIDYVAAQPESLLDAAHDPRVGMYGASYGGGIQLATAAIEPRIDAIVPDAAWHTLTTSFARDNAYKAGWLVQLCVNGTASGVLDGVTDGLTGPAGIQLTSVDRRFLAMCAEAVALGTPSAASSQWLASLGPGALVSRIRAPTLLTQGTVDTLFPPGQAIETYRLLRAGGVPVKMLWYCGGHGTCLTPGGDPAILANAGLRWLRRWLKRDTTVDTGPAFEWIDDGGTLRSAPDYPPAPAGTISAGGSGAMTVLPSVAVTLGATVVATPPSGTVEIRYEAPATATDIVGEPAMALSYRGFALPFSTFLYARVVDAAAGRVVGDQVTPIPVRLDGLPHTVTRNLEAIAVRGRPESDLRLQLVTSTPLYGSQRAIGQVTVTSLRSELPLAAAALVSRPATRAVAQTPAGARDTPSGRAAPPASLARLRSALRAALASVAR